MKIRPTPAGRENIYSLIPQPSLENIELLTDRLPTYNQLKEEMNKLNLDLRHEPVYRTETNSTARQNELFFDVANGNSFGEHYPFSIKPSLSVGTEVQTLDGHNATVWLTPAVRADSPSTVRLNMRGLWGILQIPPAGDSRKPTIEVKGDGDINPGRSDMTAELMYEVYGIDPDRMLKYMQTAISVLAEAWAKRQQA